LERRLAAILAADIVGYSRLMRADEEGTLARLKALQKELFAPKVREHRGRIVKLMGDGALVEFASAVDAVRCAVAVQEGLTRREAGEPEKSALTMRLGINLGDIIIEGDDIYGDGVNLAARLEGLAEPGGICLSASVHEQVRHKLDMTFEDLGEQSVKNIAEPVRVYRVVSDAPSAAPDGEASPTLPDKPSIAVLPFDNMSGDPEQAYLADGISEDLITALSKIRWFFVIARNSTFTYKDQAVDVTRVARELGVRYVLEGSVRKGGNRVRITAQLIDAATGRHVWAERYDRNLADIFDLQDEMTQTIVGAVEPELSAAERDRALSKPPENLDAWESYQRGVWHMWRYDRDGNLQAQNLLKRATDLDPSFAPAYAYGSYVQYSRVIMGWSEDPEQSLDAGMTLAKKALALDDKDPVGYFAAGRIYMMRGQHDDSIAALETAIELNPSFAQAYHGLGMALTLAGHLEEAKAALGQSERLSPRDPILWASTVCHALACVLSRDYEEAHHWARKTIQNPRSSGYWPHATLAAALAHLDQMDEARAAVAAALEAMPDLSLSYLAKILPTKEPTGLDPYLDGLREAGLPEESRAGG
jgi:adenylate cyclase